MVFQEKDAITYEWREGFYHHGVAAQAVGEALATLAATHGDVTPNHIVDAARPAASPLHPFIEWDRRTAARLYQLSQAGAVRNAIHQVVVYYVGEEPLITTVQAFVAHPSERSADAWPGTHRFLPVMDLLSDSETRLQVVRRALQELAAWRERYHTYAELAELCTTLDAHLATMTGTLETAALPVGVDADGE